LSAAFDYKPTEMIKTIHSATQLAIL